MALSLTAARLLEFIRAEFADAQKCETYADYAALKFLPPCEMPHRTKEWMMLKRGFMTWRSGSLRMLAPLYSQGYIKVTPHRTIKGLHVIQLVERSRRG
jgi:hypothetical protein